MVKLFQFYLSLFLNQFTFTSWICSNIFLLYWMLNFLGKQSKWYFSSYRWIIPALVSPIKDFKSWFSKWNFIVFPSSSFFDFAHKHLRFSNWQGFHYCPMYIQLKIWPIFFTKPLCRSHKPFSGTRCKLAFFKSQFVLYFATLE